ncbi:Uncharacterised protein [uncultured Clostridium sp.]|uniref:GNAT family N-acetyltransferase n=1 Tax=uncultured Clostridium sp. TaxID=59620 RepID=UPI000820F663|nr:GNAT family N-acetyltransferase [uncultured Clostridium sp.]SCK01826.1 Uncharacterised protein [uncultured Clostridium sp.]
MKILNLSYIEKIMELQEEIVEGLEDKQLYASTEKNEFMKYINNEGIILGLVTEEDELIAMGVYVAKGYDKKNYGYDLGIMGKELLKVGQIESTVVKNEFRGNRLQKIICEELEKLAREKGNTILTSTASPYNKFSVNTFLNLGYEIKIEKVKYGGVKRYVMMKELR